MGAFWDGWNRQGQVNQQQALAGLQQIRGLAGMMQEARALQDQQAVRGIMADPNIPPEQKRTALLGLVRDPVQANTIMHQMATEKATEELRAAQLETQRRLRQVAEGRAAEDERVRGLSQQLGGLLTPDVSTQGEERTPFVGTEAELVKHMQTNPGVYRLVNPAQVRSLQAQIDPERALTGLLAQQKPAAKGGLISGPPGTVFFDPDTRQPVFSVPFAPRAEPRVTPNIHTDNEGNVTAREPTTGAVLWTAPGGGKKSVNTEKRLAEIPQARQRVLLMEQNIDKLDTAIGELETAPGLERITGPIAGRVSNITEDATNAQAKLDSIKSQIFVSALQAMREASKTGGAVGNVSDKEGDKLQATLAALDQKQGTAQFKDELKKARKQLLLSREIIRKAFEEQYGQSVESTPPRSGGGWSVVR